MASPNAQASQAVQLIQDAIAILNTIPAPNPLDQALLPALTLITQATRSINMYQTTKPPQAPDAGSSRALRSSIYKLIQSQIGGEDSAFYKEIQCPIHFGFFGEEQSGNPVTLPCGHSFCRNCIAPVVGHANPALRRCPECRAPIGITMANLKDNIALKSIVDHLKPVAAVAVQAQAQTAIPAFHGYSLGPGPNNRYHGGRKTRRRRSRV